MSMTAYDPQFAHEQRGILRWFGFASPPSRVASQQEPHSEDFSHLEPRERRRRQLLGDVSRFLVTHRLDINPYTLAIAHDIITGADQRLARQIEARVAAREPVTTMWLEEVGRGGMHNDGSAALNAMMAKLEASLNEFSQTTTAARSATNEYSNALEAQVGELEQVGKAGVVISELATIAKVMLERTREIEKEMTRSEMQTRSLQTSLDEARRKAEVDHLTGLPNRRSFEQTLERELAEARNAAEPLCVAFIDIDHFKKINDTHGHDAGDRVLKAVAQTLNSISDDKCHVSRHGGEEFVILIRGKSLEQACILLDNARVAMSERKLVNRATDIPFGTVTFSGGVSDVFAYSNHREALKAADEALYVAKAKGRNCIVLAEEPSQKPPA